MREAHHFNEGAGPGLWYYADHNGKVGPLSLGELRGTLATMGDRAAELLVWREGLAEWKRAREVSELTGSQQNDNPTAQQNDYPTVESRLLALNRVASNQPRSDKAGDEIPSLRLRNEYSRPARIIDIGALLVLAGGLFLPVANVTIRTMKLIETDVSWVLIGVVVGGFISALGKSRVGVVICVLVYAFAFLVFIANFYDKVGKMKTELQGNPFAGLAQSMISLDWGCGVVTIGILAALFSGAIARAFYE